MQKIYQLEETISEAPSNTNMLMGNFSGRGAPGSPSKLDKAHRNAYLRCLSVMFMKGVSRWPDVPHLEKRWGEYSDACFRNLWSNWKQTQTIHRKRNSILLKCKEHWKQWPVCKGNWAVSVGRRQRLSCCTWQGIRDPLHCLVVKSYLRITPWS